MGFTLSEFITGRAMEPVYQGKRNWEAVLAFFDVTGDQANTLFSPEHKDAFETPQQWAAHCRLFLKINATPEPTADFQRFMAKTVEPVKV